MRKPPFPTRGAIAIILMGIALFFTGCQPREVIRERPPIKEKALGDPFAEAERYLRTGDYSKALENYEFYLKENPRGEKAREALYHMAQIYNREGVHHKAIRLLNQIVADYPHHPDIPLMKYDIVKTYHQMKEYNKSNDEALEWIDQFPSHSLRGEILFLTGSNFQGLGDIPEAFLWWIKAEKGFEGEPDRRTEIAHRTEGLIYEGRIDDLKKMEGIAAGTNYFPIIYNKMALIHLGEDRLSASRDAAMTLMQSTSDAKWISLGQEIIEKLKIKALSTDMAVGCILPLTGNFAVYGHEVLNGIQLAMGLFDKRDQRRDIELIIKDTKGNAEDAILGVEELAREKKAMMIIGPLLSKEAVAATRRAQELGIPIITLTQKEGITSEGSMVFRNFLTPSKEVSRLLDKTLYELGQSRFGILYPDNNYGRFFMNLFREKVEEMGGTITAVESYKPDQTDFAVEIKKMAGLYYPRPGSVTERIEEMRSLEAEEKLEEKPNPDRGLTPFIDFDAVFIPDNPQRAAMIIPQFPFHNIFNIQFLGTSLWQSPDLVAMAGDYAQGAIFPSGFFPQSQSENVRQFIEGYKENFESDPGLLAASGYDTMAIVKHLIDHNLIFSREDFQKALATLKDFPALTGKTAFDQKGDVLKDPLLLTISGKEFQILN